MATQDRLPTGIGTYNTWTSSSGGDKWLDVDDPIGTPDEDTTYLYQSTNYLKQSFTFTAFAIASSAIAFVRITHRAYDTVGTSASMDMRIGVNSIEYASTAKTLNASYATYTHDWLTNPNTGAAWVEADVEGTGASPLQEFGIKRITGGGTTRCTQSYITVDYTAAGGGLSIPIAMYHYQHHIGSGV